MVADKRVRVVSRREPIITVVDLGDEKLEFVAHEIPRWRARNDFGNFIVQKYTEAMNSFVHVEPVGDDFLLRGQLFEKALDYGSMFRWAYGSYDSYTDETPEPEPPSAELLAAFEKLDWDGAIAVLEAALEVNGLEGQQYMLDPRKSVPKAPVTLESLTGESGPKMESLAASG